MRVVVQCKSHARPLRPEHVRELEGAVEGAPPGWRSALGLLVGPREASRGVRERVGASKSAVGFVMVDGCGGNGNTGVAGIGVLGGSEGQEDGISGDVKNDGLVTKEGKVRQFLWNWVAQERGLQGLGVTVKYTPTEGPDGKDLDREIALTWNGWMIKKLTEGTSPESTIPSIAAEIADTEMPAPKKRGRPRKQALEETSTVSQPVEKKQTKSTKRSKPHGQKKKK
jgi:hypothetical protein